MKISTWLALLPALVVPANASQSTSMTLCRRLVALSPEVTGVSKRVLDTIGLAAFDQAIDEESRVERALGHAAGHHASEQRTA